MLSLAEAPADNWIVGKLGRLELFTIQARQKVVERAEKKGNICVAFLRWETGGFWSDTEVARFFKICLLNSILIN